MVNTQNLFRSYSTSANNDFYTQSMVFKLRISLSETAWDKRACQWKKNHRMWSWETKAR